jgi:hypothetical protein
MIKCGRVIPILCEDALMLQEIKNEPPRAPSTPRNKKLRDLAQLHKETVLVCNVVKLEPSPMEFVATQTIVRLSFHALAANSDSARKAKTISGGETPIPIKSWVMPCSMPSYSI